MDLTLQNKNKTISKYHRITLINGQDEIKRVYMQNGGLFVNLIWHG